VTPNDEHVRAVALEVLRRSEYARWREAQTVGEWLRPLLAWLEHLNGGLQRLAWTQPVLYWLIIGGLLCTAALLLAHVAWSVRAALSVPAVVATARPADGPSLVAEAEALAARGRFLDAAHRLQLATIELLLRRRVIALSRFEANRVLRARLASAALPAAERRTLLELVGRLEARWFRDRTDDADLYADWRALHRRLDAVVEAT
jgi:hypothetical protein